MALFILLLVVVSWIEPGASEDLSCLLADKHSGGGAVWSIGITFPGLFAEYFGNNPVSGVCMGEDHFFTSGASSTIGGDPSTGGHIAVIGITGVPVLVAQFPANCTDIECDTSAEVLVVVVEGVGISACLSDGSDCWTVVDVTSTDIGNIYLDTCTQTCYFVDRATSSVYAVNYMVRSQGAAVSIGSTGAGAVGCTLDYVGGTAYLDIMYSNCAVERCPISGPFTGCSNFHASTGGNCQVVTATADYIITYDIDSKMLVEIDINTGTATSSTVDVTSVTGMDCSLGLCENEVDDCASMPCLHGGTCVELPNGYSCTCVSGLEGQNCENGTAELIALVDDIEEFEDGLNTGNFSALTEFYAENTIIEFLDFPQLRGKDGHAQLVSLLKEGIDIDYAVTSSKEIRQLCDICFETRFTRQMYPVDPQEPVVFIRLLQVWCFDFESLKWQVKSLAVTPDPQD